MLAICIGAILPWSEAPRSGILGLGKYALALAAAGLILYTLATTRRLDPRWWRLASVPLALGCLALAIAALTGYGALGAVVTAVSAVAWIAAPRRPPSAVGR
ncbi:MAG: hypothetical protein ACR2FF_03165 [Mycobacteriales bacterium]